MFTRLRQYVARPTFVDQERERSVASLYWPNLLVAGCGLLLAMLGFLIARHTAWALSGVALTVLVLALWSQLLLRRGYVQIVRALLCISAPLLVGALALLGSRLQPAAAGGYVLVIALAGFLIGWRGAVACGAVSLLTTVALYLVGPLDRASDAANSSGRSGFALVGGVVAVVTLIVVGLTRRTSHQQARVDRMENQSASREGELGKLNTVLRQRLELLHAATVLSSRIGPLLERDQIARRTVALARELLGVDWAGLFLSEPPGRAEGYDGSTGEVQLALVASSGESDQGLGSVGEQIRPSLSAPLARCMSGREPQVLEETDQGWDLHAVWRATGRQSVVLFPLRVETEAIGVLAFSLRSFEPLVAALIDAAKHIADEVGLALHRADAYARVQASAELSERLVQRYVEESWDELVASQPQLAGYRYTPRRSGADEAAWLPPMTKAVQEGGLVSEDTAEGMLLGVPLVQSGITIGAIGLRRAGGQPWDEAEQLLVRSASEQVTQALENRRLFELARDRAQRERLLREITERIRSQADLDGSLAVAADRLRRITGATHVAIRLSRPDPPQARAQSDRDAVGNDG